MSDLEQQLRAGLQGVADQVGEPSDGVGVQQVHERIARRARRRRTGVATGSLAALLALGAGGLAVGSQPDGQVVRTEIDGAVLATAASETVAARSFRFATTAGGSGPDGQALDARAEGVFGYDERQGRVSAQLPEGLLPGTELAVEAVVDDAGAFVKVPAGLEGMLQLPEGKRWVRVDLGPGWQEQGVSAFGAIPFDVDPAGLLERFRETGESVELEEVGTEKVRGADTTHYRYTSEEGSGDVWVDEDNRLRRVSADVGPHDGGADRDGPDSASGAGEIRTTTEFFDFGTEVDVTRPPAAEVVDLDQVPAAQMWMGQPD